MLPRTEALLYAADRAQHVDELVRPALERGAIVLSDRYIDSTIAYQGAGRDLTAHQIRRLSEWATGGLWPDRTYLFDMTPRAARERLLKNRGDNMDRLDEEPLDFQIKTRDEYFRLAAAEPKRFVMIDAAQTEDTVTQQLCADLAIYLHDPALAKDAQ